jgi:hypothetical protein
MVTKATVPNFQRLAGEQGREWRDLCVKALYRAGFAEIQLEQHLPDVGITLDIVATNLQGISLAIECKGSMMGNRPGSKRTDTVLKAIGEAFLLSQSAAAVHFPPMILMTSHIASDKAPRRMLGAAPTSIIADVLNPYNHARRIAWWADADERAITAHLERYARVEELLAKWDC